MGVKVREKDKDSGIYWIFINYKGKRTSRQIGTIKAANKVRIPTNPTSDSDLKASTDSDAKHPELETVRRWGEHHFRSGWLRSNSNLFSVETCMV